MSGNLAGISNEEFERRQHALDVEKWLASEQARRDLCGTFSWCGYCVKAEQQPCARAQMRETMDLAMDELVDDLLEEKNARPDAETRAIVREEAREELAAEDLSAKAGAAVAEGYEEVTRYRRTFLSRIIQNAPLQDGYSELKNALLGFAGVKTRLCKASEIFRIGRQKLAKFAVRGKTLSLYLALDPAEFEESKYRFEDVSDKKSHAATPMRLRITSRRAVRHAKELIRLLMQKYGVSEVGCIYVDQHFAYRSDAELIADGLITPYRALVKKRG